MFVASVVLITIVCFINKSVCQSSCVTPNGDNGICVDFKDCKPFTDIWNNRTSKNIIFFRKSYCGYQNNNHMVCCGTYTEFININSTPTINLSKEISTEESTESTTEKIEEKSTEISSISSQLFTSAITETSNLNLRNNPSNVPRYKNHANFNLLPTPGKCGLHTAGEKITNGKETDLDEYPWLAMLLYRSDNTIIPNCGGSLINTKYVLTAAHCILGSLLSVRLGEHNVNSNPDCIIQEGDEVCNDPYQQFEIEDFFRYTNYSNRDKNRRHDIALIRLKGEANITDYVRPICLPVNNERSNTGDILTVAGWGVTENNVTSPIKLTVDLPVWSDVTCREIYSIGYKVNLTSNQFCAGGAPDGKDSCTGDSGGPLMKSLPNRTEYYADGIVSFGPKPCGRQATPGVYVRVADYMTWILDTIKP